jgi:hypothetical protein
MAGEIASLFISRMAVPILYFVANRPRPQPRQRITAHPVPQEAESLI